jgi:Spy/CpxP family protein refolding chaperone
MQDAGKVLTALVDKPNIDQAATLAKVDEILAMEREVKRAQLTLLIKIKNTLTPAQQAKLETYRK